MEDFTINNNEGNCFFFGFVIAAIIGVCLMVVVGSICSRPTPVTRDMVQILRDASDERFEDVTIGRKNGEPVVIGRKQMAVFLREYEAYKQK